MKIFMIALFFNLTIVSPCLTQSLDKLEIWGWDGTKEDFATMYQSSTGKDLSNGYVCMADSFSINSKAVYSTIWPENAEDFMSGNVNWENTERLAIIRPSVETVSSLSTQDSLAAVKISKITSDLSDKDSAFIEAYLIENPETLNLLLMGMISDDLLQRHEINKILSQSLTVSLTTAQKDLELLASMLSFPDPKASYMAMKIIGNSGYPETVYKHLFSKGALTLIDFLNSNLQTFKGDALLFLHENFPDRQYSTETEWVNWIQSGR
ncbi:MAG: hypothetical protein RIC35_23480 [Marinoscillum sp.]